MKPDEIAELERLLEEATPGPWEADHEGYDTFAFGCGPVHDYSAPGGPLDWVSAKARAKIDGALIAAMRNALPELLRERRELLAERRELRALVLEVKGNALYRAASLKMATFDDDEGRRLMRYYWLFTRWAKAIREGRR